MQLFHLRTHKKILQITEITGGKYEYFQLLKRKIHGILQQCNNEKGRHITPVCIIMNLTHLFSINKPHELSCRFGTSGCAIHTNSIPNLVAGATAHDLRPFLRQSCNKITISNNDKYSVDSHVIVVCCCLFVFLALQPFLIVFSTVQLRALASSFTRFLDHTQRRAAVGRTPLDE